MTGPYYSDDEDLEMTHEYGEATCTDVVSTYPGADGGDGSPRTVTVRKPLP